MKHAQTISPTSPSRFFSASRILIPPPAFCVVFFSQKPHSQPRRELRHRIELPSSRVRLEERRLRNSGFVAVVVRPLQPEDEIARTENALRKRLPRGQL